MEALQVEPAAQVVGPVQPWPPHWPYLGATPEPPVGAEVGAAEVGAAEVGLAVAVGAAEDDGALPLPPEPPDAAPLESEIWALPPPDQDSTAMTWKL